MTTFEKLINRGLEYFGKFYGNYIGIVMNNLDPDGRGRIQVIVPKISVTMPLQNFAIPKGLYNGKDHSLEILPSKGDNVIIEFVGGSILNPVWSFGPYLSKDEDTDKPQVPIKPGVFKFKTPKGYEVTLNENEGTYRFHMAEEKTGLDIYFDSGSNTYNITVTGKKECSIDVNGDSGIITINGGDNEGMVNVDAIRKFSEAVQQDLMSLGSGTQVSKWMAESIETLEDKNLRH